MGNGGTAKCPVQFTQGLGRAAGIPGQVEAIPSGFCCLQIKTTETSANQIQSNVRRLVEQMSVTRTQIEGDVRRIQQFIQQVRNFLSGSAAKLTLCLCRLACTWKI